ncbi:MAG: serine hydrolase [Christensenellales bacterium]|jgi:D-alanyl-D-alanine carboxypeptidase (penicillin-binding protein 5/6)
MSNIKKLSSRIVIFLVCAALAMLPSMALAGVSASDLPVDVRNNIVLIMEPESGSIIFAQNENKQVPVASITKIMTLLLIFEAIESGDISPEDMVTVSKAAAAMEGSRAFLDAGSQYSVSDLIRTIIISSANDSSVAMAEHIAGSESAFVEMMNRRAMELLMPDTVFKNSTGLPAEGQYSTAADVSIMARALMERGEYGEWFTTWMDKLTHPSGRVTDLTNTNRLVRFYSGTYGLKTGYSGEAGHCIAASAKRGDMSLLTILLGIESSNARFNMAQKLLDFGFASYEKTVIVRAGDVVSEGVPVRGSTVRRIDLIAQNDISVLTKKGSESLYTVHEDIPSVIFAPATVDEPVGGITVRLQDGTSLYSPIVISRDELPSSFFSLITRILSLW